MIVSRFSPLLLSFCLTAFSLYMPATVQAGASNKSGNPYGNGSFFGNDGTFSGVIRGVNVTGTTQFSTYGSNSVTTGLYPAGGNSSTAANIPGVTSLYYLGFTYMGPANGVIDPVSGQLASTFNLYAPNPPSSVFGTPSLSGAFTANLQNSYPNQSFSGRGSFNDGTNENTFTVTGVRISSGTMTFY